VLNAVLVLSLPVILIASAIPLILKRIPPNDLYGYRTPSVIASPALWYAVNGFLGWALAVAGAAGAVLAGLAIARGEDVSHTFSVPIQIALVLAALVVTWCYRQLLPAGEPATASAPRPPMLGALGTALTWLVAANGLVLGIPLALGVVPPNRLYGYRTPTSVSSPALWYQANHVLGWAMIVAGVASVALAAAVTPRDRRAMRGRALMLEVLLFLVAGAATWGYVQLL